MNEEKSRIAKERELWQKLVEAMRAEEQEKAKRLAAEADRARDEQLDKNN